MKGVWSLWAWSTYLLHGVLHQFVQVLEPLVRVLMLEVATHCEHDVVCAVVAGLKEDGLDKLVHSLVNVVIK